MTPPKPRYGVVALPENMSMAGKSGMSRIDNVCPSYLIKCLNHPRRRLRRKFEFYPRIECLVFLNSHLKLLTDFPLKERYHVSGLPPVVLLEINNSILVRRKIQTNGYVLSLKCNMRSGLLATFGLFILPPALVGKPH